MTQASVLGSGLVGLLVAGLLTACGSSSDGGAAPGNTAGDSGSSGAGASGASGASAGGTGALGGSAGASGAAGSGVAGGTSGAAGVSGGGAGGGSGGASGSGGAGAGGGGASGGAGASGGSSLPIPPGGVVPKPAGTPGNLSVLNWAGFKGAVTYSFDDDNTSQIQNYAALQALGVPFTFFMWTGKAEASNSIWATALKDGHEIGNHTLSHDPTGHCTLADISSATSFIQTNLGIKPVTMAAPNGNTCYKPLAQGVFFINRGVSPAQPVMPNGNSDALNLNCYIPAQGQQANTFNANVDDGRSKGGWVIYVVHGFTGDGSAYQPVDLAQLTAAITYTKSLSDMWIGTMENVASYWLGQKAFSTAMTATVGGNETWTWTLPAQFPKGKYLRVKVDGGTLTQNGSALSWSDHGYYEVALDVGSVTLGP